METITKKMYQEALAIVNSYEKNSNKFVLGAEIPCCDRLFWFEEVKKLHVNYRPKMLDYNPKLKYRECGMIDYDSNSREPKFCNYNEAREAIRQAKQKGYNHCHWSTCAATDKELIKDGYIIHNDINCTISW